MLSVASLRHPKNAGGGRDTTGSAGDYWLNLARDDYYQKGGEPPGQWFGKGAEKLELRGKVIDKELRPILDGFNPHTKEPYVRNAGNLKKPHMPCWDLAFSAPKSVSLVWAMADETTRHKIQEIQQEAVNRALLFVEEKVAKTRRGYNGILEESPSGLIISTFEHSTSRDQDPQLHTHSLVANMAPRNDGSWGALEGRRFYDWKMATGAYYRAQLSHLLDSELGLEIERDGSFFRLASVPKSAEKIHSQRRLTIEKVQKELGSEGARALDKITLKTRKNKGVVDRKSLFYQWQKKGMENGFGPEEVKEIINSSKERLNLQLNSKEEVNTFIPLPRNDVLEKLTDKYSVFREQDVYRYLAEEAQGIVEPINIHEQAQSILNHPDVLSLRKIGKHGKYEFCFTTVEMRNFDRAMVSIANNRTNEVFHRIDASFVSKQVSDIEVTKSAEKGKPFYFSDDQKTTIKYIFNSGGVCCVRGKAGAGKSTSMEVVKNIYESSGFNVFGVTFSGKATAELKKNDVVSQTLDSFFLQIEKGERVLSSNDVIILDEAGMVGSKKLFRILSLADEVKSKVILVGDEKQLQPIAAGAAFKAIQASIGGVSLSTNFRQQEDWQKEAVEYFEHGDSLKALERYAKNDSLVIGDSRESTLECLIEDWKESVINNRDDDHLMIVNTRSSAALLNEMARGTLLEMGDVEEGYLIPTKNGKTIAIGEGDTLLLRGNSRLFGVYNGDIAKVIRINPSKDVKKTQLRLQLESGKLITLPVGEYNNYEYGYAVTTHKSQGSTIDHTFVLVGDDGLIDRESSYVQNSRHSVTSKIYLDKESLEEQLDRLRPTEAMIQYAEDISEKSKVSLPSNYESSFRVTREFLDEHSGTELGFDDANGMLKGLDGLIHRMNQSNQKETTLDYDVIPKSEYGKQKPTENGNVSSIDDSNTHSPDLAEYNENELTVASEFTIQKSQTVQSDSQFTSSFQPIEIEYKRPFWDKDLVLDKAMYNAEFIFASLVPELKNDKLSNSRELVLGRKGSIRVDIEPSSSRFGLVRDFERGYHNNLIGYVSEVTGKDWYEALEWVAESSGLNPDFDANTKIVISSEEQARREEQKRKNAEAEQRKKDRSKCRAVRVWSHAMPIDGTLAEIYLREHRGISADLSKADFRFHPEAPDTIKNDHGDIASYVTRPALVVGIRNSENDIVSAQLVYLDPETADKHPEAQVAKRTIASSWGHHAQIHLGASNRVILAEGPETAASLIKADPSANIYISVGNNQNMGNLAYLAEKHGASEMLFASDNDGLNAGSDKGLKKAASKLAEQGILVKEAKASALDGREKSDYNDILKLGGDEAVKASLENWRYLASPENAKEAINTQPTQLEQQKINERKLER